MDIDIKNLEFPFDGTNALVLPAKRKKEKKVAKQESIINVPYLRKSQKRKLKKLKEEKEKKVLEQQTAQLLRKHKISDATLSFLKSSATIGQVETKREKRLRAVQFSKAGVELPVDDHPPKKYRDKKQIFDEDSASQLKGDVLVLSDVIKISVDSGFGSVSPLVETDAVQTKPEARDGDTFWCSLDDLGNCGDKNGEGGQNKLQVVGEKASETDFQTGGIVNSGQESSFIKKRVVVNVRRPSEIEKERYNLPVVMMEQEIMEAINENSSIILCGETGCGKTTQVPQFLYEAGYSSSLVGERKGVIGVTQPRRVAVLATTRRVAFELGLSLGKEVGFQVRHDKMIGANCAIKFMTDGILLREMQSDFLLKRYSVIILDEAHERSLNTDILIGLLSRAIQVRQVEYAKQQEKIRSGVPISIENLVSPLKIILMSATLRVEDFISNRRLFCVPPPVIEVPTRQHPVSIHFSRKTEIVDYVGQAYKKVMLIHKKLPPGGILVFVTGQREVEYLCRKLRRASRQLINLNKNDVNEDSRKFSSSHVGKNVAATDMQEINEAFEFEVDASENPSQCFNPYTEEDECSEAFVSSFGAEKNTKIEIDDDSEDILDDDSDDAEKEVEEVLNPTVDGDIERAESIQKDDEIMASLKAAFQALSRERSDEHSEETIDASLTATGQLWEKQETRVTHDALYVLPLYAMLSASAQLRVFESVPDGKRLVVVATNVAETSITIPGIKYVVDTGREKVKNYNHANGMARYDVQWISKASAAQRAGRAGRTGPGHCYRLYSSAVFTNIFSEFSNAEITKLPVDGVVLLMKYMGIDKVANFPFPTPPETSALNAAEQCLKALEALDVNGKLTSIGKAMAVYPMSPRHSRMLLTVIKIMEGQPIYTTRPSLVLGYAVAVAAAFSFSNPFLILLGASKSKMNDEEENKELNCVYSDWFRKDIKEDRTELNKHSEKLQWKKLKEARTRFFNPSSDALTIAYALQMFELSENQIEFCKDCSLHYKTMDEMSKMRKQLLQLIFHQNSVSSPEFKWEISGIEDVERAWRISSDKHPLLVGEQELLGQAICAGWADRVAKRLKSVKVSSDIGRKISSVPYQSCMLKDPVYLHRSSSVSQSSPEFVVYNELLNSKRPYLHGVTSVKSRWLVQYAESMCILSAPCTEPKPYYEPTKDQIKCWVTPTFGPYLWELPLHSVPLSDNEWGASVFACALLEGNVLPCFKSVKKFLVAKPAIIIKPEALGQRRVRNLMHKLCNGRRTIDSRAKLREAWKVNPEELRSELLEWYHASYHSEFGKLWDQMHREVILEVDQLFPGRVKKKKKKKSKEEKI